MAGKKKVLEYIVWDNHGYGEWSPMHYDTLREALNHESYGSEHIVTRRVEYSIEELPSGKEG